MLETDTRRQIVQAATVAARMTAASDYASGRRVGTLTSADAHIVADLARRLAARSRFVQRTPPRDLEHATATFAFAFSRAYVWHLGDLGGLGAGGAGGGDQGQGRHVRDAEQLAADVLAAVDQLAGDRTDGGGGR